MGREWKEVPDETEENVLEDTQEYRVAGFDGPDEESPQAREPEEFEEPVADGDYDEPEAGDEFAETREFDEDLEYEEDEDAEYEGEYADEAEDDAGEYYEDDEYFDDEELDERAPDKEPEPLPVIGKPYEPVAARVRAIWAAIAAQTRGTDLPSLPDKPKVDAKLAFPILAIVIAALAVGIGAYAIGKGSGDDVDVARLEGEAAGKQAGAIEGASRGYAEGFVKGRDEGFRKTYEEAYRLNFKRAFEQAGLDVPSDKDIDVPEP